MFSYKLVTDCVALRPIARVVNAVPFSFFNATGHTSPTVALGILADPDKGNKDAARKIIDNSQFVVNLVPEALAEQIILTCMNVPWK